MAAERAKKEKKKRVSIWKKMSVILCVLAVIAGILCIAYYMNHITSVEIDGNSFYTDEEIKEMVLGSDLEQNAWYLYCEYNYFNPPAFPFIDKIEVELNGRGKVKLHIYEKSIVGYVEYLGNCMYFDKDGTVVESSAKAMKGVPKITGLQFDSIVLYQKLPVEKQDVFTYILTLTKELKKNEVVPDKIQFNKELEATLYFGQARVALGKDDNQNEKIARLKSLLPQLEGKSGILHMEEVEEDEKTIVFKQE